MSKKKYCYAVRVAGSLGAGSQSVQQLNFASDSDFVLEEIRTSGEDDLRITMSNASGDQWSNTSLNVYLFGRGNDGVKDFGGGIVIPKNSQVNVTFDNQSGAGISNAELQLWGYKV